MSIIECNNLVKSFGKFNALDGISFSIEENTITGLIGRNGAGKTTLLKTLAGFIKSKRGEVKVFGENPFNSLKVSSNTFFADDKMSFPKSFYLKDILETASKFYSNWDMEFAKKLFDYFEFYDMQEHSRLSKGMVSTFNMIIAISSRTPLTILDEPTTGMDSAIRKDFYKLILKDYIANPRTIIISSHLLPEIEELLENILLMNNGKALIHKSVLDFKEMAIHFHGDKDTVDKFISGKRIYHKQYFDNLLYVAVENAFNEDELQKIKIAGVEVSGVSSDDLCNYLTAKTNGGIENVLSR